MARALFTHCKSVYEAMSQQATLDENKVLVYEGYLTRLFDELGLNVQQFSHVMTELKRMDCVRQLKRGGGSSKSIWLLVQPPDPYLFEHLPELTSAIGGPKVQARFEQAIKDLGERITTLEEQVGKLNQYNNH